MEGNWPPCAASTLPTVIGFSFIRSWHDYVLEPVPSYTRQDVLRRANNGIVNQHLCTEFLPPVFGFDFDTET
jgi:hypothetical protein